MFRRKNQRGQGGLFHAESSCGSSGYASQTRVGAKMKSPLLIFPVDEDGVPFASREILDTRISSKLERYLLELDTFPGKDPSSIVISEQSTEMNKHGSGGPSTPGLVVITANGKITFHSYSGGAGTGMGTCPELKPVQLRQGWAVWSPERKTDSPNTLRVRIFGTEEEAESACVLMGA